MHLGLQIGKVHTGAGMIATAIRTFSRTRPDAADAYQNHANDKAQLRPHLYSKQATLDQRKQLFKTLKCYFPKNETI